MESLFLKTSAITKKLRQSVPKFVYATEDSLERLDQPGPTL
uniref:Uncharacterized protein n=1 Tax=Anguilla anguilla TaxID=7936 RepID=A0A0E9UX15_ANGAN